MSKFCVDCKYYGGPYSIAFHKCIHEKNLITDDVSGRKVPKVRIQTFRAVQCKGNLFEEKEPVKLTLMEKFFNKVFGEEP